MVTHVLDTSAWLAHAFGEPGNEIVQELFQDQETTVGISAVSLLEAYSRMKEVGTAHHFNEIVSAYKKLFAQIVPADEAVVIRAISLREASTRRIPTVDSMIAATAAVQNAILVHRDPHFQTIPENQLQQLVLAAPQ